MTASITEMDRLELIQMLKDECALNGVKFTVTRRKSKTYGETIILRPAVVSRFVREGIPEFKSNHLSILRDNADAWGFTYYAGTGITQLPLHNAHSSMQEEYYFPISKRVAA